MIYDPANEVVIHLRGDALKAAKRETRKLKGWLAALRFKGPHFRSTDSVDICVAVGSSTINVGCTTDSESIEYVYPLHSVGRVKVVALNSPHN